MLLKLLSVLVWCVLCQGQRLDYYMDQLSTCNQKIYVESTDITINARSNVATPNPPLDCVVYLESTYSNSKSQLQVVTESMDIKDCGITVTLFDNDGTSGSTLRVFGCSSKSTDTAYSSTRYLTIRLKRTSSLFQPSNDFTFRIRAYEDPDKKGVTIGGLKIPVGGIIGIILALLALIVFGLILAWCYKSGRIPGLEHKQYEHEEKMSVSAASSRDMIVGADNPAMKANISRRRGEEANSPPTKPGFEGVAFSAITGLESKAPKYKDLAHQRQLADRSDTLGYPDSDGDPGRRYTKRQNSLRNSANMDRRNESPNGLEREVKGGSGKNANTGYAQIAFSEKQLLERKASLRSTKIKDGENGDEERVYSDGTSIDDDATSQSTDAGIYDINSRRAKRWARNKPKLPPRGNEIDNNSETNRDYLPPGKANQGNHGNNNSVTDTAEVQASSADRNVPEMFNDNLDDQMYSSIDQVSDPLLAETIDNPMNNGGPLKNSVSKDTDLLDENGSPTEKRRNKRSDRSPKRKKKENKAIVEELYLPEASEPVFTTDTSSVISAPLQPYDNNPYGGYTAPGAAGMMPMQMFNGFVAPYVYNPQPGTQTMVYAYQTGAPGDPNGNPYNNGVTNQAGIFVQSNSPSKHGGPVNKAAFMMSSTQPDPNSSSKRKSKSPKSGRKHQQPQADPYHPGMPNYTSTPGNGPYQNSTPMMQYDPNTYGHTPEDRMALAPVNVAQVAIPPSVYSTPHSPQRSAVMKTKVDPHSGVQSTQVTWTDAAPHPTDPVGPDCNPKISRKTVTRVTTKGGHGELPEHGNIFQAIDGQSSDHEFLSPTSSQLAIDCTPARNPAFIAANPHENQTFYSGIPSSNQPVIHSAPTHNTAIKDTISIA